MLCRSEIIRLSTWRPTRLDVVEPLDAHVDQFDAQARHQPRCGLQHLLLKDGTAFLGANQRIFIQSHALCGRDAGHIHLPVGRAHDFLDIGTGDRIASR